ncbi:Uncharacterised protein [Vibrio cholerae]|nr:Uncharacterised protein [Vibrio cholerae]
MISQRTHAKDGIMGLKHRLHLYQEHECKSVSFLHRYVLVALVRYVYQPPLQANGLQMNV